MIRDAQVKSFEQKACHTFARNAIDGLEHP